MLHNAAKWAPTISESDLRDHYQELIPSASSPVFLQSPVPFRLKNGHVDPDPILQDANALVAAAKHAKDFADKHVAHLDVNRSKYPAPSLQVIDTLIDTVDKMVCKYALCLTSGHIESQMPVILFDWTEPYQVPWLPRR